MTVAGLNNIVGILLAGGLSRRMGGGDKCLADLGGRTMLAHVIDRLRPQVAGLVINANGDPARFKAFGLPVVADPIDGFAGPLAGVLAGMRWAAGNARGATHIATVSSDAPFIPADLVARLVSAAADAPSAITIAGSGGHVHPVIGLWPIVHADDLESQLNAGIRKVLHWTDRHGTLTVEFEPTWIGGARIDPFFNANRPEELEEARGLVARALSLRAKQGEDAP